MKKKPASQHHNPQRHRNNQIRLASAFNLAAKIVAFLSIVINFKYAVPFLGQERFGILITIISFATIASMLDFGFGNAISNHITAHAANKSQDLERAISASIICIISISILSLAILSILAHLINITSLFKSIKPESIDEAQDCLYTLFLIVSLNIIANGVQKIYQGLQKTHIFSIAQLIGYLLSIPLVIFSIAHNASISQLLASISLPPIVIGIFTIFRLGLSLNGASVKFLLSEFKALLKTAPHYLSQQLGAIFGWGSDTAIISSTMGPSMAAKYQIMQRFFQTINDFVIVMNSPAWPAYADAKLKNENIYINHTFKKFLTQTIIFTSLSCVAIALAGPEIATIWTSGVIKITHAELIAMATISLLFCISTPLSILLNGVSRLNELTISSIIFPLISIPVKIFFSQNISIAMYALLTAITFTPSILITIKGTLSWRKSCRQSPQIL